MSGKLTGRVTRSRYDQRNREHLKEHSPRNKAATWDQLDPVKKTPTGVRGKPGF